MKKSTLKANPVGLPSRHMRLTYSVLRSLTVDVGLNPSQQKDFVIIKRKHFNPTIKRALAFLLYLLNIFSVFIHLYIHPAWHSLLIPLYVSSVTRYFEADHFTRDIYSTAVPYQIAVAINVSKKNKKKQGTQRASHHTRSTWQEVYLFVTWIASTLSISSYSKLM